MPHANCYLLKEAHEMSTDLLENPTPPDGPFWGRLSANP